MTAETPRTTALRKILPSVGTSEELCLQLAGELEQELNGAREAADAATKGVYSATMLEAAKVSGTAMALRFQLTAAEADLREAREQIAAMQSVEVASDRVCKESDGCPTERAVLQREWRWMRDQIGLLSSEHDAARARVAELEKALKPFANFACDEPCQCNNCVARALLSPSPEPQP